MLLILVLAALLCKFKYRIRVLKDGKNEDWDYDIRASWLFGIIRRSFPQQEESAASAPAPMRARARKKAAAADKTPKPNVKPKAKQQQSGDFSQKLKELGFDGIMRALGHTLALLRRIIAVSRPKAAIVQARFGAANPDTTGMVLAATYAAAALLSIHADIEGDFEKEELQLDVDLAGSFRLWAIFWPAVVYILKPEIRVLIFPKKAKKAKKIKKVKKNLEVDKNGNRV